MFPPPKGQLCKACGQLAVSFHSLVGGWCCEEHLKWAQNQFNKHEKFRKELLIPHILDYQI